MSAFNDFGRLLRLKTQAFVELNDAQAEALRSHYELMVRWNRTINLTRIESLEEAVERHYAESLFLASHLPEDVKSVADIGSGAGFPGFPIAVLQGEARVTLVESDQRKAAFLRETRDWARNIEVQTVRSEQLKGEFDVVVSRAVKPVDVLKAARRVGKHVGLLLAETDAAAVKLDGVKVIPLPYRPGGVLLLGDVPRGTTA